MRSVRVSVYWLAVGLAVMVVSPLLSIVASVQIAERGFQRSVAAQRVQDDLARQEQIQRACVLVGSLLAVYQETPPSTPAGRSVQLAYLDYYNQVLHCTPTRR